MARVIETVTRYRDQPDCRTAGEMTDNCCVTSPALPCCEEVTEKDWQGYSAEEILDSLGLALDPLGRDAQGRYVEVRLRPRRNPCGEKMTRYNMTPKNCCDFVEPMAWDDAVSVDVLAPETRGIVGVTGGAPPYHWSVRGEGFSLNAAGNIRDGWTDTPYVWIYATIHACGWAPITVTDGCSEVRNGVKSTEGSWVDKGYDVVCHASGSGEMYAEYNRSQFFLIEKLNIQQYEQINIGNEAAEGMFYTSPENCNDCPTNPETVEFWQEFAPYSNTSPCVDPAPAYWPCRLYDPGPTGGPDRYVCCPVTNRWWKEWRC